MGSLLRRVPHLIYMSEQDPQAPSPPPAPPAPATPLDQASLSEFVARRAKGETAETPPTSPEPPKPPAEPKLPDLGDEPPPEEPQEPGKPAGKGKKDFQSRFDQIYRQRSEALREVEAHKARIAALEAEIQQARAPKPAAEPPVEPSLQPDKPPVLDEWLAAGKTYEDWLDARNDYRIQRAIAQERQREAAQAAEREYQSRLAGFAERTEAARQKYPDYEERVMQNDRVQLSPVMMAIGHLSPHGPDLLYWLATHEAEANEIGRLTKDYPVQATYPHVEHQLLLLSGSATNGQPGAKKAVPVSQAPAPISPVGGGSTTSSVPLDEMPLGDFVKRRNAEIQKRRTG
jgi:hypothetical protein